MYMPDTQNVLGQQCRVLWLYSALSDGFSLFVFPKTYLVGIIISICGNVLISVSLNIQVGNSERDVSSTAVTKKHHNQYKKSCASVNFVLLVLAMF